MGWSFEGLRIIIHHAKFKCEDVEIKFLFWFFSSRRLGDCMLPNYFLETKNIPVKANDF